MNDESKKFSKRHWYGLIFLMIVLAVIAIFGGGDDSASQPETGETMTVTANDLHPEFRMLINADGTMGEQRSSTLPAAAIGGNIESRRLDYTLANGHAIYQGDILLDLSKPTYAGLGIIGEEYLWPGGVVPYEVDARLPDTFRIDDAIEHWEAHTGIRFVERSDTDVSHSNYIKFVPSVGCASYVGMQNRGMQPIYLARACSTGNTIHEIGHALGLWHEHSRNDRDEFVDVRFENIIPQYTNNFVKQSDDGRDIGEYDYGSIMHYPSWAFSKNGKDTIVPYGNHEIGQRDELSADDIAAIQDMYKEEFETVGAVSSLASYADTVESKYGGLGCMGGH